MGSSVSQALIIVAGVIIAMLVMAFVNQTFIQTGKWASTQDQEQKIEQVQKFNQEWEVYDKKLMYGVDVISCLNKALSNNDKINNGTIVNGEKYDASYEIKVVAKLNKELQEEIKVYYLKCEAGTVNKYSYENGKGPLMNSGKQICFEDFENFKVLTKDYMSLEKVGVKSNERIRSLLTKWDIEQLEINKNSKKNETITYKLITASDALSEVIKNKKVDASYAVLKSNNLYEYNNQNGDQYTWTEMEFKSYLYDLKTRKFTCTGITYKADSGRVDTITFKEL